MASSKVKTFTSKGNTVGYSTGQGPLAQVGHFDPATGTVYTPARIALDGGIRAGSHVRITQPKAAAAMTKRRNASLGMGGALSSPRGF
jgi:hypothetical protein